MVCGQVDWSCGILNNHGNDTARCKRRIFILVLKGIWQVMYLILVDSVKIEVVVLLGSDWSIIGRKKYSVGQCYIKKSSKKGLWTMHVIFCAHGFFLLSCPVTYEEACLHRSVVRTNELLQLIKAYPKSECRIFTM